MDVRGRWRGVPGRKLMNSAPQEPGGDRIEPRTVAAKNIARGERLASGVAGGFLLSWMRRGPRFLRLPLLAGAGYMLARALRGRDPVAEAVEVRRLRKDGAGPFIAERSVTIQRDRDQVYGLWRDLESLPRWMNRIESVRVIDDRLSHWIAHAPAGRKISWDAEITQERAPEYLAWRSLPGSIVDTHGDVEFRHAPGDRGTEVRVRIHYQIPGGTAAVLLAHFLGERPDVQLQDDLRRFKQLAEAGETAVVEGQPAGGTGSATVFEPPAGKGRLPVSREAEKPGRKVRSTARRAAKGGEGS
ncbi:MAG: cyclase [Candidatus Eisenbacteria bacterium]|nr:cyclase [Candidatus Eisenbacteria bacterium]